MDKFPVVDDCEESMQKESTKSDRSEVNVVVRCRPLSDKESKNGHKCIVEFKGLNKIIVHDFSKSTSGQVDRKSGNLAIYSLEFEFNRVFGVDSKQKDIYDDACRPIVEGVLEGYNGTIFAYGQTGTGKTFTMEGNLPWKKSKLAPQLNLSSDKTVKQSKNETMRKKQPSSTIQADDKSEGVIPRTFKHIFEHVSKNDKKQFLIRASYIEIYQEKIYDLLRRDKSTKLELHERSDTGVYVKDLTSIVCKSLSDMERVMRVGNQNRMVGATDMNERSSRSHSIFTITIEQQESGQEEETIQDDRLVSQRSARSISEPGRRAGKKDSANNHSIVKVGKLNLVDLAGSERQKKTNSFGERQKESIKINLSLSALGNVINSLMSSSNQQSANKSGNSFVPYRDSKLTRILQDSLGGNAQTLMIANIGPASYNYDETINTLNYASRAKRIRNQPRINEDPKDALLRQLQREIHDLRSKLKTMVGGGESSTDGYASTSKISAAESKKAETELIELRRKLASLESKLINRDKQNSGADSGGWLDQSRLQLYTDKQELELQRSRAELANREDQEKAIRDELERREEAELLAKESFSSTQQEIEAKKRLILQILLKVKSMHNEIEGYQDAFRLELEELDQLQFNLQKELKLKYLIMDNFIPNDHVTRLLSRIVYDEKTDRCSIEPIDLSIDECNYSSLQNQVSKLTDYWHPTDGLSVRPRSEFERIGETIYPASIRFRYDNLIEPKLDVPNLKYECLNDAEGVLLDTKSLASRKKSQIQALIDSALGQHEPNIVI